MQNVFKLRRFALADGDQGWLHAAPGTSWYMLVSSLSDEGLRKIFLIRSFRKDRRRALIPLLIEDLFNGLKL